MAIRAHSICNKPGCMCAIAAPGYCDKHKALATGWNRSNEGKSNTERGYGYRWRKLRDAIMRRDCGVCQPCQAQGRLTPAGEVDHIIGKARGGKDDAGNLQAICRACHAVKTAAER